MKGRIDWAALTLGLSMIIAVVLTFEWGPERQITAVREAVFDEYQRMKPRPFNPDGLVRVIDIDEESLKKLGQWPWPRTFLAEMVYRLTNAGAAAIAFDMVFSEPDRTSPGTLIPSLQMFGDDYSAVFKDPAAAPPDANVPDHDASFGWLIGQAPVILGIVATDDNKNADLTGAIGSVSISGPSDKLNASLSNFTGAIVNLPALTEGASGIANFSLSKFEGGIVRNVPLVTVIGERRVPSLSIEALRVGQGAGTHVLKTTQGSGEAEFRDVADVASIKTGGVPVPLDADGTLRVRYSGANFERVIPAHKLLEPAGLSEEVANEVAGRILLVGTSATGLFDLVRTPLTERISGVHVHAEIIEQVTEGVFLSNPDWALGAERLTLGVFGLLVVVLLAFNFPLTGFIVMLLSVAGTIAVSWFAFSEASILLNPILPVMGIAVPHVTVSGYKFFTSEASRREVTRQFEHFVSPEVIQDIIDDPESHLTPGGAQRELSIMFLDVRRFSTITEKMEPQEVIAFINKLLTPLTDAIIDNEGTIDKYMGDAVMAFWNAPRATENHQLKSVRAMLDFDPIMSELNEEFTRMGLPDIDIGVGINTGECSVGNMGSLKRLAYSCVGDSVNLAARLEGQTKAYGVRNLIGSATAQAAMEHYACIELDAVAVKGRTQPETIYTVAGDISVLKTTAFENLRNRLIAARNHYLKQDWDASEAAFHQAADLGTVGGFDPRPLAGIMIERIMGYRIDPPDPDWDGVYVATSK